MFLEMVIYMAFSIFLNFEKLSQKIIENEIGLMTDDNQIQESDDLYVVNEDIFENNLYHGSIVATFIVNLYETTLNTILGRRLGFSETEIFKCSHNVKLQLICSMYNVELESIKSNNSYSVLQSIVKLRNDITHYKSNEVAVGHFISVDTKIAKGTSKESLSKMFTKTYMSNCYNQVLNFLELLCYKCGLVLCKECQIIDCDGRDAACEFVLTQEAYNDQDIE